MAQYTSEIFLMFALCGWVFAFDGKNNNEVTVKYGGNVTLNCSVARDADILMMTWIRPDLKQEGYVFFYRDGRPYKNFQHPSFAERVNNAEIKNGTITVQLCNATANDTGTYECHVTERGTGRSRRAHSEIMNVIKLTVTQSGDGAGETEDRGKHGHVGLVIVTVFVVVVVVAASISALIFRKRKSSSPPPPDKAAVHQLL